MTFDADIQVEQEHLGHLRERTLNVKQETTKLQERLGRVLLPSSPTSRIFPKAQSESVGHLARELDEVIHIIGEIRAIQEYFHSNLELWSRGNFSDYRRNLTELMQMGNNPLALQHLGFAQFGDDLFGCVSSSFFR